MCEFHTEAVLVEVLQARYYLHTRWPTTYKAHSLGAALILEIGLP